MKNEARAGRPLVRERTRLSIVLKLSAGFFFELLGIFLALDLVLGAAFASAVTKFADRRAVEAASETARQGMPEADEQAWLEALGVSVGKAEGPEGFRIPSLFQKFFLDGSLPGARYFVLPQEDGASFYRRLDGLSYRAELSGGRMVSVGLGDAMQRGKPVFWSLLIAELLFLYAGAVSRSRGIRRTLRPIEELAETARSLNSAGEFTPEEMRALAGKINNINASRLDTRIAVDTTQDELKNLAAAINAMLDRIDESYRAQVRFVSDASHELRTPIAVIQGYASLLDRWGKNDEKALEESIEAIKSEADNMKLLVEQLLFLARGDNDTMILQMERFDVSELAEQVLRETKMIDAGHEYESRIEPAAVEADEALVKQALRILVDNAIKYTPAGGRIAISTFTKENQAWVTVQDNGIGIPSEAVPQIFDRFFRTDESRARATGGAGLGLSIAKWIAERHGGHMEVLSREALGTRISMVLPSAREEKRPEPEAR
jgi:signal transduction histidine kinase